MGSLLILVRLDIDEGKHESARATLAEMRRIIGEDESGDFGPQMAFCDALLNYEHDPERARMLAARAAKAYPKWKYRRNDASFILAWLEQHPVK